MLKQLHIRNYVIIDTLEIQFSNGMNIVTGETGAGKSIILGALSLILGERADTAALVDKEKKCIIEGLFTPGTVSEITQFLEANDLDPAPEITIRREIGINGKSRAFINDTPVNLAQLQQLSSLLVDLHQQFDTLQLGDTGFQVHVLDALANNAKLIGDYRLIFAEWQQHKKKLEHLKEQQAQLDKESDYNQFQYDELAEANFLENELEEIDASLKLLSNSEGIKGALGRAYSELEEGEQPLVQQLKSVAHLLGNYSSFHKDLPDLVSRLNSAQVELQDIATELEHISNGIHYDPEKIETLSDRLSMGYRLQKKHGVHTTNELLALQKELEEKLQGAAHIQEDIAALEAATEQRRISTETLAQKISEARKKQIAPFEKKVDTLLTQVGMPNAALRVSFEKKAPGAQGADAVDFLFDANKSGQFKPVNKVASGGELSRLMLCIKSLVAQRMNLPTLIFDEIDTGISGEAAKQVGIIMKDLASSRQVICITHQPQIAGRADAHYFVYKEVSGKQVRTGMRQLDTEERITAIAKMLSGEKPTAAALENAREMVQA
ncbi:DNA repair protein RecN [Niabella pedocola]|uniref:DNA repair protein RecN n=1 Tax=Niabella pedocola TaxID=1752077 RepID=A0ABS8PJL5_9BACT|nr:DNA repair protein RecN [Niabella pedocola]MCD2421282.1 DNA repair protein RecN [Niabella pedocola]